MTEIDAKFDTEIAKDLEPIKDVPIAPAHGIAAIALNMAMKFYDINTVQDGVLYQQYKMEGKNMHGLHLDHVLDTATRIEMWLLGASERIAKIVVDAIAFKVEDDENEDGDDAGEDGASGGDKAEGGDDAPGSSDHERG